MQFSHDYLEYDPREGLIHNFILEDENMINFNCESCLSRVQKIYRIKCYMQSYYNTDFVTFERKANCIYARISTIFGFVSKTHFRMKCKQSLILSMYPHLEKYVRIPIENPHEFKAIDGKYIVNYIIDFPAVKEFIDSRNREINKEIIENALHPCRINKWIECGFDVDDLFLID